MQRLLDLIDASQPGWVLVILNLHDIEKRRRLMEEGFAFIATPYLASVEVLQNIALCPSFTAVEASVPREVKATWQPLPQEDPVSICLADAFQEIANTHWEALSRDSLPGLLNRAWYLLNQLSTCPVPLPFYEKMRRYDPREKSLGFWLDKLDRINWQQVPDPVRGLLLVHWHSIVEQLRAAYAALEQNNPLWWYLADLTLNADTPMMLLMPSRVSSQAFRENMMLEFEWTEESSNVTVMALNEAHRQTAQPKWIVWLGSWADWQRPLLWGLGASEVQITGYPYEALVLSKRLRDIQQDLADTLRQATARATGQSTSAMKPFTLKWDQTNVQETCQAIRRYWNKQARGGTGVSDTWDEESDNLYFEENIEEAMLYESTADEIAEQSSRSPAEEDEEDEMIAAIRVNFTDGGALLARADHEFMVLPKDKSDTEQRIASQLQPGDRVLVFSAAQHADVFDLVLSRTQHLLDIDRRVVDFWKQALRRIRLQYPSDEWGRGVEFCEALEQLGCERDRVTMRTWLTGTTMAPRAEHDIACVLQVSEMGSDAAHWAQIIAREMNDVRSFHRRIGRRIMQRVQSQGETPSADLIDAEIDELLEETELRIIDHVSDLFDSPKGRIGITVEGDGE